MTKTFTLRSRSRSPDETAALAARLAPRLGAGDALLLSGSLGSGKSHFARALIRARMGDPEAEVPSPSYTLVQTYDGPGAEIWHADLYRLSGPDEVLELGLAEAFETAICLVEWPERLADDAPRGAIWVTFEVTGDSDRVLTITGPTERQALFDDLVDIRDAV